MLQTKDRASYSPQSGKDQETFEETVAGCIAGDDRAIERLYSQCHPLMRAKAENVGVDDPEGIADLAFASAIKALERLDSRDIAVVRAYFARSATNRAIDERRRGQLDTVVLSPEEWDSVEQTNYNESDPDTSRKFVDLLKLLTPSQQEVVAYRFLGGFDSSEIADRVGRTPEAVRQLEKRALARLRRQIAAAGLAVLLVVAGIALLLGALDREWITDSSPVPPMERQVDEQEIRRVVDSDDQRSDGDGQSLFDSGLGWDSHEVAPDQVEVESTPSSTTEPVGSTTNTSATAIDSNHWDAATVTSTDALTTTASANSLEVSPADPGELTTTTVTQLPTPSFGQDTATVATASPPLPSTTATTALSSTTVVSSTTAEPPSIAVAPTSEPTSTTTEETSAIGQAFLQLLEQTTTSSTLGSGANLYSQNLITQSFVGADLRGAHFGSSSLSLVDFSGADLSGANFSSSSLSMVDFSGADLSGANFDAASIGLAVSFLGAEISGATFNGTSAGYSTIRLQATWDPNNPPVGLP